MFSERLELVSAEHLSFYFLYVQSVCVHACLCVRVCVAWFGTSVNELSERYLLGMEWSSYVVRQGNFSNRMLKISAQQCYLSGFPGNHCLYPLLLTKPNCHTTSILPAFPKCTNGSDTAASKRIQTLWLLHRVKVQCSALSWQNNETVQYHKYLLQKTQKCGVHWYSALFILIPLIKIKVN